MKFIVALLLLLVLMPARFPAWQSDLGNGSYQNPILFGLFGAGRHPDVRRLRHLKQLGATGRLLKVAFSSKGA